jgi:hypothetical protein
MDDILPFARIYKLVSSNGLIYIGSTTQSLNDRLQGHKDDSKRNKQITSKQLFIDNASVSIEIIEELCNIILRDLRFKESQYIKATKCVNKVIPGRTSKEYNEDNKDKAKKYYEDNKDKINNKAKKYYEDNKDKIINKSKKYYEDNKDKVNESGKKYRESNTEKINDYRKNNKDRIKKWQQQKILCVCCNKEITKYNKPRHEKTIQHITNNITNNITTTTATINNAPM